MTHISVSNALSKHLVAEWQEGLTEKELVQFNNLPRIWEDDWNLMG